MQLSLQLKITSISEIDCFSNLQKMAKILLFICFALFVMIVTGQDNQQPLCSPLHGQCKESSDCCRHLLCMSYAAKCVQKGGLIIPGQDTRPLEPFPKN